MTKPRHNNDEPNILSVYRSRDLRCMFVSSHREVIPMGYVNSIEEFDGYVALEYPKAVKKDMTSHRGTGEHYWTDGDYNIFYHTNRKLNTL